MTAPKGKHLFGTVKVGEKGQIVIPKDAREIFGIQPGDSLVVLGDEATGLAIMKNDVFLAQVASAIFHKKPTEPPEEIWSEPTEKTYDDIKALVQTQAEQ
jgi:AbrB family looped-hinge helix DNA binding protein